MAYKLTYVGICKAGAYASGYDVASPNMSLSITSYGSLAALLEKEASNLADGCWIVDASKVDDELAIREAVRGPITQGCLTEDEGVGAYDYCTPKTKAMRWKELGAEVRQHSVM